MAGLNKWTGMGNLVANAETRYTQSGQPVTSARIACNERYYSNGQNKERTEFVNLVMWGKRGEALNNKECLQKGQSLFVSGRLQTRSWEAQDGSKRYTTEIVVGNRDEDFQLLARRGSQVSAQPNDVPPHSDEDVPTETSAAEDYSE